VAKVVNYAQAGYTPPRDPFLGTELYKQVSPVWVKACADVCLFIRTAAGQLRMIVGLRGGGRLLVSDDTIQKAIVRKIAEEFGIAISPNRVPDQAGMLQFMRWSDDNTAVLAPLFFVEITDTEWRDIQSCNTRSKELSELRSVDPRAVMAPGAGYHQLLRGIAKELLAQMAA